jgi:hypothetical protein
MTVINTNISALTAHYAQRSVNNMVRLAKWRRSRCLVPEFDGSGLT